MFEEEKVEAVFPDPLQCHPSLGSFRPEDLIQVRAGLNIRANALEGRTHLHQSQTPVHSEMEWESGRKLLRWQADRARHWLAGLFHAAGEGVQVT